LADVNLALPLPGEQRRYFGRGMRHREHIDGDFALAIVALVIGVLLVPGGLPKAAERIRRREQLPAEVAATEASA
jgi:hypothetical protein